MNTTLIDTETIGFVGAVTLIQYKTNDNPIVLYCPWKHSVKTTLDLIEKCMEDHLVAFNFTFDSFHLCKLYNTFRQLKMINDLPDPREAYIAERTAWEGKCLKPAKVTDLFLLLKDTSFQFLNKRKQIAIKNVPVQTARWLEQELMKWDLNPLLFAKKHNGYGWNITKSKEGFVDLKLIFAPSIAMKKIVNWLFGLQVIEFNIDRYPAEKCPFSKVSSSQYKPYDNGWIDYLDHHVRHWQGPGKEYAEQDIICLHLLKEWFAGHFPGKVKPEKVIDITEDNWFHINSELAWQVGAVRQRGFDLDLPLIKKKLLALQSIPTVPSAPAAALKYLLEVAEPMEKLVINSTDDDTLQGLAALSSPMAERAKKVIAQRTNEKKILLFRRLLDVKRFHPNFSVIGTFSGRMSGASGINPQGINREERDIFLFHDDSLPVLSGGDFDSQELTIAARVYEDAQMSDDLSSGFDLHSNSAKALFPVFFCEFCQGLGSVDNNTCGRCNGQGIELSEEVTKEQRHVGKNGFNFPLIFGAVPESIHFNTRLDLDIVRFAYNRFFTRYPGAKLFRDKIEKDFCSMIQPKGLGTEVIWHDPIDSIASLFGYKRFFDVENYITKKLFNLAQQAGKLRSKERVERKEGKFQLASGATSSALYAAAFNIQAKNLRQAGNHVIQSTGAGITKSLQLAIWDIQPKGINDWEVCPYNVHDEVMVSNNCPDKLSSVVKTSIEELRKTVPLLKITWKESLGNWSEKG